MCNIALKIKKDILWSPLHLRTFATIRKNVKCSPLQEFNVTLQGDWVWCIVFKFDVDPKSTG